MTRSAVSENDRENRKEDGLTFGLDGRSRERTSRRVSAEERSHQVGDADRDQFLIAANAVIVDATERLCDGDVLEEKDDSRDRQLRSDQAEQLGRETRLTNVLKPAWDGLEDRDVVVGDRLVAKVDPCEDSEKDDDEGGSERHREEGNLLDHRVSSFLLHLAQRVSDDVEEQEARESVCSVALRVGKMFQSVDYDAICRATGAATSSVPK